MSFVAASAGGAAPGRRAGRTRWTVALICLAILGFWVVFLGQAERAVFGRVPILDEVYYLDRAAEVAAGTGQDQPYFISPLYPRLAALTGAGTFDPEQRVEELERALGEAERRLSALELAESAARERAKGLDSALTEAWQTQAALRASRLSVAEHAARVEEDLGRRGAQQRLRGHAQQLRH